MAQIDWKKAPKWANWWAMDANGVCYFYEEKPFIDELYNWWNCYGNNWIDLNSEKFSGIDWKKSLTCREAQTTLK